MEQPQVQTAAGRLWGWLHECYGEDLEQQEIAEAIGVSPGSITNWKAGRGTPRGDTVVVVADKTGVSRGELLEWVFGDGADAPKGRRRKQHRYTSQIRPDAPPL